MKIILYANYKKNKNRKRFYLASLTEKYDNLFIGHYGERK